MTDPQTQAPSPSRRPNFLARPFLAMWKGMRPGARTRRISSFAALLGALACGGYLASRVHSGQPWYVEAGIGAGIVLIATVLVPLAVGLAVLLWRIARETIGGLGLAAYLGLVLALYLTRFPLSMAAPFAVLPVLIPVLIAGGGNAMANRSAGTMGRVLAGLFFVAGLGSIGFGYWWLGTETGSTGHLVEAGEHANPPATLAATNPSAPGGFAFDPFTYGSGSDRHREEYGAGVPEDLLTTTVNGKPFGQAPGDNFSGWFGLKGQLRDDFWGFGLDALPRNGRGWMPRGDGPFPLVLMVHGNHSMGDFSDPGYAYLGELLASRGIAAVSVDENFLNGSGFAGGVRKENDLRAWMLLEHLDLWRQWNATDGHRFAGRIDFDRIGLIGHSRGGEAVELAAVFNRLRHYPDDATVGFDYGFGIQGVVSIAPVDGQYRPADHAAAMQDVSYFVIHGGHDADVSSFHGDSIYRRLRLSPDSEHFKASAYVYRANHGQFNSVWGDTDIGEPMAFLLNRAALMPEAEQQQVAKVYLSSFFAITLQGDREYLPLFQDAWRGKHWLPESRPLLVTRYEDATFEVIADFEEDVDVTTGAAAGVHLMGHDLTVWREGDIHYRSGKDRNDHGVFLGWSDDPKHQPRHRPAAEVGVVEASTGGAGTPLPSPHFEIRFDEGAVQLDAESILVLHATTRDGSPKAKDYRSKEQREAEDGDNDEDQDDTDSDDGEEDDEELPRIVVELETLDGVAVALPLSNFGVLPPALEVRLTRADFTESRYKSKFEAVLQGFRVPLQSFRAEDEAFDPARLATIRLRFVSPKGTVLLDRIGFAR